LPGSIPAASTNSLFRGQPRRSTGPRNVSNLGSPASDDPRRLERWPAVRRPHRSGTLREAFARKAFTSTALINTDLPQNKAEVVAYIDAPLYGGMMPMAPTDPRSQAQSDVSSTDRQ